MEIKENLKQVKEEFKGDEKLLESTFRIEKFYKKYKVFLWLAVIGVGLWWGYTRFLEYKENQSRAQITRLYNEVLANPDNLALRDELKQKALPLYHLYTYAQALKAHNLVVLKELAQSKDSLVAPLARYYVASYSKDLKALTEVRLEGMQAWIALQRAYLTLQTNPNSNLSSILAPITPDSSLYQIASVLRHYNPPLAKEKK
ncbi:hypothetical protein [Helicobacter cynogastricus]|uniref:hypothetical protein n=1 Tax=Helicobacter cynogastricus TaxID=329937 RepID=UPI000CF10AD8|nr:hypothetical protein [Helicobacter cynogastricus]